MASNVTHGVPAVFSFFIPGVGQIIKGHFIKGIFFLLLNLFFDGLAIISMGVLTGFGLLNFVIRLLASYDAYN